mgnify:CR=1 FL=1
MKDIVIVGSGGFAKEVAFLIDEINKVNKIWNLLGYIDVSVGEENGKYTVYGTDDWLASIDFEINVVFGVGDPVLLKRLQNKFKKNENLQYPNLIHPNVIGDWARISIGVGNIICASNTFTTDIKIGDFNIVNIDCTIGHDVEIGDFNVINPSVNISGGVKVNDGVLLGTNATILQNNQICSDAIIGADGLVTKNIEKPGVYIGSPVKKIVK